MRRRYAGIAFEGAEHGAEVPYFYVENQPGEGHGLHCFTNVGEGALRILGIHPSPTIIQTFLD